MNLPIKFAVKKKKIRDTQTEEIDKVTEWNTGLLVRRRSFLSRKSSTSPNGTLVDGDSTSKTSFLVCVLPYGDKTYANQEPNGRVTELQDDIIGLICEL